MKERRMWKNTWLKELAMRHGLEKGKKIIVRERSLLKDYTYITREIRHGVVLELYPHHFYCQMENGRRESFRYNEFLGHEARLIRLREKQQKSVQIWTLFCCLRFRLNLKIMCLHPVPFQSSLPDT